LVSRKKVRMYLSEDDLAVLLGYWSKGNSIPVELKMTGSDDSTPLREVIIGPDGRTTGNLKELAKTWLEEEGVHVSESGNGLQLVFSSDEPITIEFRRSKARISCRVELGSDLVGTFHHMKRGEVEAFVSDLKMVLALKPCDFSVLTKSGAPVGIEVSATIYADGFTKDRMMSVLSEVKRSVALALTIVEARSGRSALERTVGGHL